MRPVSYKLTCEIRDDEKLGTIVAALAGCVVSFNIEACYGDGSVPTRKTRSDPKNPQVGSGWHTWRCVTSKVVVGAEFTRRDLADWLEKDGFAATSASPLKSKLVKQGFIEIISDGVYRRIR